MKERLHFTDTLPITNTIPHGSYYSTLIIIILKAYCVGGSPGTSAVHGKVGQDQGNIHIIICDRISENPGGKNSRKYGIQNYS